MAAAEIALAVMIVASPTYGSYTTSPMPEKECTNKMHTTGLMMDMVAKQREFFTPLVGLTDAQVKEKIDWIWNFKIQCKPHKE